MIDGLKPYKANKDSGVLWLPQIPTTWEMRRNGRLFVERNETNAGELPILEVSLRTGVRVRNFYAGSRKQVMEDREKYKRAKKDDLAYNMMRMWQGAVGVVPSDGLVSPAYVVARPLPGVVPAYFEYLFRTDAYKRQVNDYSRGIVADRNRLYWDSFKQIPTPFPPPDEQAAIVRFLDHADRQINRYIRAKNKVGALLAEERERATNDAIGLSEVREMRLSDACLVACRPIDRQDANNYTPVGLFNRGRGIFHKPRTLGADLGDSSFYWIEDGDFVLSGQFAWEGAVALANKNDTKCVASHRYHILRGKPRLVNSAYLFSFFRTGLGQLLLDHHSRGAAGRNRPLNARTLLKEKIPIPPLLAQERIAEMVQAELDLRHRIGDSIGALREYRTRLVADVVTGKLDVRDAAAKLPVLADDHKADPRDHEEFVDEDTATDDDAIADAAE